MQTPSDRCAVRWTRARRTERAMPACYKYFRLLLLSRLHFHAISLSCLHILNISLSMVKALIHFSTPHKIILKSRKRTMQCFDIFFFYLVRHFDILDRSTHVHETVPQRDLNLMSETSLHNLSDPSSHLKKGQNENQLVKIGLIWKKTAVKKVKTDKISEVRGPIIISPKRIYGTVKRMFDRAIAIYWEKRYRRMWRDMVLLIPVEISTGY